MSGHLAGRPFFLWLPHVQGVTLVSVKHFHVEKWGHRV